MKSIFRDIILIFIGIMCHLLRPNIPEGWLPVSKFQPTLSSSIFTAAVLAIILFRGVNGMFKVLLWIAVILLNELFVIWTFFGMGVELFCSMLGNYLGCNENGRIKDDFCGNLAYFVQFELHNILEVLIPSGILWTLQCLTANRPAISSELEDLQTCNDGKGKMDATPDATHQDGTKDSEDTKSHICNVVNERLAKLFKSPNPTCNQDDN